jgi:Asp-tRNA(Asn)/Glu-tRNA(Gln) amidotransferase C subunit
LKRLHELSALEPPAEGTLEHAKLTRELENLVRLVEAVKSIEVESDGKDIPDGRIWVEGVGMDIFRGKVESKQEPTGTTLLKHAAHTLNGSYVVESSRNQ